MSSGGGRTTTAGAAGAAALVALSFVLGAATEVSGTSRDRERRPLSGTAATVEQSVELTLPASNPSLFTGAELQVGGAEQRVALVALGAPPDPLPGTVLGLSRQGVDDVVAGRPQAVLDGDLTLTDLRCGQVVALAADSQRLPVLDLELRAIDDACAVARGAQPASVLDDPVLEQEVRDRAGALLERVRAAPLQRGPATVSRLSAQVVAGRATRAAVRVSLQHASGAGAPGELFRVAYPGGSLLARTDGAGVSVVDVPDIAVDADLPLRVSWHGSAPAGYPVAPYPAVVEGGAPFFVAPGFLLDPVPYVLQVDLRRHRDRS